MAPEVAWLGIRTLSEEKKQKGISEHTPSGPCGQLSSKYSVEKTPQGRSDVSISLKNYRRKGRENIVGEKKLYFCQAPLVSKSFVAPPISWVNWEKSSPLLQRER